MLLPGRTHVQRQTKSSTLTQIADTRQIEPCQKKANTDKELKSKYSEYRLDAIVDIIENLSDQTERHKLLKEFEEYLNRKGSHEVRAKIIKGQHTQSVKEELYQFVNCHWHHVLGTLKSYEDFCKLHAE